SLIAPRVTGGESVVTGVGGGRVVVQGVIGRNDDGHLLGTPVVHRVQINGGGHSGHGAEPVDAAQFGLLEGVGVVARGATGGIGGRVLRNVVRGGINGVVK